MPNGRQRPRSASSKPAPYGKKPAKHHGKKQGLPAGLIIGGGVALLVLIVLFVLWMAGVFSSSYQFERRHLDAYMQSERMVETAPGAGVYVDFSNGMNYAYSNATANRAMRDILNKLTGDKIGEAVKFYSLADAKIEPLDMSATEIYNRILAPESFSLQQAPIRNALARITDRKQAALLITDYEEYNGRNIEQQAYAKDYFIDWLQNFSMIVFYKIDYLENGKEKKLFFTVFDNDGVLLAAVDQALQPLLGNGVDRFVMGGKKYRFPISMDADVYKVANRGGNYHNSEGVDLVSAVSENDGPEDYHRYYGNVGSHNGKGAYENLTIYSGMPAEYYPIGNSWNDVVQTAKDMSDKNVPRKDRYMHFMQGIWVDLQQQNGYDINGIEARCYNMEEVIKKFVEINKLNTDDKKSNKKLKSVEDMDAEEVSDMFTVTTEPVSVRKDGNWEEIFVDFDKGFNGSFTGNTSATDLLRLNIVIDGATPRLEAIRGFFGWSGNESLTASIQNALQDPRVNPKGSILWSYFMKVKI